VDALSPIIKGTVEAAINGGMSAEDAIGMAWDYFQQGGDVDFMLPDDFKEMVGGWDIPGFDINWPDIDIPGLDIDLDLPDIDLDLPDIDIPDLDIDITNPCEEGQILNELGVCEWPDLPSIDVEVPDLDLDLDIPNPCEEGQILDEFGVCQWPDLDLDIEVAPDGTDCDEGFNWDSLLGQCVEIQVETPEGPETPEVPDVEVPEIPTPEMPTANYTPYNMEWTGLFDYTNIDVYQGEALAPMKDYIKQAKGMLS
jgi:hypothetical protein